MATAYLDTSALARVLLDEPDAGTIRAAVAGFATVAASRLLRTELRRIAQRDDVLEQTDDLLDGIVLIDLDDDMLSRAETVAPTSVATLGAIHLATALKIRSEAGLDALITFDRCLADGARHHGITVLSPA